MSWERDPLLAKAKLYFGRAFATTREDPMFGLLCSFGLELLGRAAVASISPTLLAEPDQGQRNLLYALNRASNKTVPRSLPVSQVVVLCQSLFEHFTEQDAKTFIALINRRNDELHTGSAAFEEFPPRLWLASFYATCSSLSSALGETLESLFGDEEADVANRVLADLKREVRQRVEKLVQAHRQIFLDKSEKERLELASKAKAKADELAFERHHRVQCPACGSTATVRGEEFGEGRVTLEEDEVVVRRTVLPSEFQCTACQLRLTGYAELEIAHLGGQHTRTTRFTAEEYYGLIDPDNLDIDEFVRQNYPDLVLMEPPGQEYDND